VLVAFARVINMYVYGYISMALLAAYIALLVLLGVVAIGLNFWMHATYVRAGQAKDPRIVGVSS
jgi:hypothetical protein